MRGAVRDKGRTGTIYYKKIANIKYLTYLKLIGSSINANDKLRSQREW